MLEAGIVLNQSHLKEILSKGVLNTPILNNSILNTSVLSSSILNAPILSSSVLSTPIFSNSVLTSWVTSFLIFLRGEWMRGPISTAWLFFLPLKGQSLDDKTL